MQSMIIPRVALSHQVYRAHYLRSSRAQIRIDQHDMLEQSQTTSILPRTTRFGLESRKSAHLCHIA